MTNPNFLHFVSADYAHTIEFQTAYSIFTLCDLYWSEQLSLPQFAYVLESFITNISLNPAETAQEDAFSPEQCLEQLERLAALYKIDSFKNPYIVERSMQIINNTSTTISLSTLSRALNLSPAYLSSVISKNTGIPFRNILFCRRLISFVSMVYECPQETLETVALRIGYKSVHQFSKSFSRNTGISPSSLKRNLLLIRDLQIKR